jgi:nucleoside-diphosphate-sugar epimerase
MGAIPVVVNALDRNAVIQTVVKIAPDVIVHELTAIPPDFDVRKFRRQFITTNLLRTQGTDNLLAAAHAAGVRRFVAQSICGWPYAQIGDAVKREEDCLDSDPPAAMVVSGRRMNVFVNDSILPTLEVGRLEGIRCKEASTCAGRPLSRRW